MSVFCIDLQLMQPQINVWCNILKNSKQSIFRQSMFRYTFNWVKIMMARCTFTGSLEHFKILIPRNCLSDLKAEPLCKNNVYTYHQIVDPLFNLRNKNHCVLRSLNITHFSTSIDFLTVDAMKIQTANINK